MKSVYHLYFIGCLYEDNAALFYILDVVGNIGQIWFLSGDPLYDNSQGPINIKLNRNMYGMIQS